MKRQRGRSVTSQSERLSLQVADCVGTGRSVRESRQTADVLRSPVRFTAAAAVCYSIRPSQQGSRVGFSRTTRSFPTLKSAVPSRGVIWWQLSPVLFLSGRLTALHCHRLRTAPMAATTNWQQQNDQGK